MKKLFIFIIILASAYPAVANQQQFCAGFQEGFKSVRGGLAVVPPCPPARPTPANSTVFREGINAGIQRANQTSANQEVTEPGALMSGHRMPGNTGLQRVGNVLFGL